MKAAFIGLFCLGCGLAVAMGTPPRPLPQAAAKPAGTLSVMLRDDDLRVAPETAANVAGRLAKGASVRVLASQGGWTRVEAGGKSGWVRVLSVRSVSSSQAAADLAGLVEAGTSQRDPGKIVAVAGVRGLDQEILQSAAFNPAEIQLLESYALARPEAEQFALAAGLQAREMPYFAGAASSARAEPANEPANESSWKGIEP
jgi:hypothetical protein